MVIGYLDKFYDKLVFVEGVCRKECEGNEIVGECKK